MFSWSILSSHLLNGLLYLDPGSGSFILQILIATLMGGLVAVKIYWGKIKAYFRKDKTEPAGDPLDEDKTDEL